MTCRRSGRRGHIILTKNRRVYAGLLSKLEKPMLICLKRQYWYLVVCVHGFCIRSPLCPMELMNSPKWRMDGLWALLNTFFFPIWGGNIAIKSSTTPSLFSLGICLFNNVPVLHRQAFRCPPVHGITSIINGLNTHIISMHRSILAYSAYTYWSDAHYYLL
jgi:hypothetical protein